MVTLVLLIIFLSILIFFYVGYYVFGAIYSKNVKYISVPDISLPNVSIIIATFNEEKIIEKKIENTIGLNYPKDKLEIIFVDSSTDKTRSIIKKFAEDSSYNVVVYEEDERKGLATALNIGYSLAKGDIVVKADSDLEIEKDSIREIVKPFSNKNVGAVSGAISIINQSSLEVGYRKVFERLRLAESNIDSTYLFNPFSAFRKDLIQPIDKKSVADDAELALKIRRNGFRTVYSPAAIAYEVSPTSISERITQKSRRAQGHIRLMSQNLGVLFNKKYGKFGLFIFPSNFFMMILSPWLILLTFLVGLFWVSSFTGVIPSLTLGVFSISLIAFIYLKSRPRIIAGFLDSQLNLLIGLFKLVIKGPDFKWRKDNRSEFP